MDDIFKKSILDIVIDGGPVTTSYNDIIGSKVRCFWDGGGVVLACTLIGHYNGKATLYDKETRQSTTLKGQEYLKMTEAAFGKRE